jgi:hypothetical protein
MIDNQSLSLIVVAHIESIMPPLVILWSNNYRGEKRVVNTFNCGRYGFFVEHMINFNGL